MSGTRRTISRAVTCSRVVLEAKAVNSISATSASLIHACASSSQIALVYLIGVQAAWSMLSMALRTGGSIRAVMEKRALCRRAAAVTSLLS